MQKNTKNKAFIYLLLLCLLYVGGQQRVWGQTTEIDRPEPFITVKRVDPRNPAYIYYEFDTNYQLAKPLTLQNLFTEYLYLLPPANPADTFVIVDTLFNDQRTFPKEYKTCTTCISYTYQQYHKGYLVQGADLRVDLKDQLVVKLAGRRVPNLDAEVTNVMSKDAAWDKAWNATLENLLIPRKVKVRNWTQEEVDLFEQTYKCRITKAPNYPIPYFYESYISDKNKHLYHVFDVLWHFSGYRVKIDANTGEIILPKENNQLTEGEPGYSCSESGWVNETIEHDNCNKFATPWDSGLSTQSVEVPVSLYANTESLYGGTCENLNISTYTEDNTLQSYLLMSNKVQLQNASSSENNAYFPVIGWCYEQGNPINKPNLISKGNARNQIIEATAYSSAQKVVNYWSSIGINGYDGAGHCLNVLLYDNTVITKWSQHPMGNYLNLNYVTTGLKASVTLDVVAHEATHGLLLNYFKISNEVVDEAAGLHEGICDIMSVLVRKHANFPELSTTDINATAFPNVASLGEDDANMKWLAYSMIDISHDELPRYIKNPWLSQSVQAAYYNTNAVITGSVTNNYIPSSRYNIAGVITYWFYLLSEGTSPTTPGYLAQTVQGVGMSKAEEVLLAGLKRLFQNDVHDPSFADFAQGVIQACNADPANFPPAVFGAVQDAFCAVNLCSDGSILGSMDIDLNYQITPAGELQACFTPTGLPTQGGRFMMPDDDDLILDPSVWWTVDDGDINTDNISTEEEVCFTLTEDESVNVTLNVLDPETGQIVTISEEAYYNSLWVNGPEDVEISTSPSFTVAFVPPHPANWTYFWTVYEAGNPLSIIENNTATTTPYLTLDEFDLNETTYVVSVMVCDDNTHTNVHLSTDVSRTSF
jgi:Zn-dependent metalloprotease